MQIIILAGPNGAGKSTLAPSLLRDAFHLREFVNADTLARGLSAFQPERVAFAAGRVMLRRLRELVAAREDFAFETTLATRSFARGSGRLAGKVTPCTSRFCGQPASNLPLTVSENVSVPAGTMSPRR